VIALTQVPFLFVFEKHKEKISASENLSHKHEWMRLRLFLQSNVRDEKHRSHPKRFGLVRSTPKKNNRRSRYWIYCVQEGG
jgi:hypothetical protein